jgi:micrococcal nuclease
VLIRFLPLFASLAFGVKPLACAAQSLPRAERGDQGTQQEAGCVVSHVVDGDTFYCRDRRKVRLIGIDSPERQQEPFGASALRALHRLLPPGTQVRMQLDLAPNDRYGRLLAYVWVGSTFVNEAMVREGWAVLYTVPPNVKYADRLMLAQKEARALGTGLWAEGGFACLPGDFRRRACVRPP